MKKYIQLTEQDVEKVRSTYHNWQSTKYKQDYQNIPEYCYSATYKEIENNGFSLIPSKYIEFVDRDNKIDFDREMKRIQKEFKTILKEEIESQQELLNAFKGLGYEIKL